MKSFLKDDASYLSCWSLPRMLTILSFVMVQFQGNYRTAFKLPLLLRRNPRFMLTLHKYDKFAF